MTCPDHQKIVTAFTIGYFTTFLKDRLIENKDSEDNFGQSFIIQNREEIKETIFRLYEGLFEVQYGNCFYEDCIEEIKESIDVIIDAISEEIQKQDDAFLELAFLSGSFLSVANTVTPNQIDKNKFEAICSELLSSLKLNVTWTELEKLLQDLTSETLDKKYSSRNELFATIANSQSSYKKVYDFQSTLDNISYQSALLYLAEARKYITSVLLLICLYF
jgi:hypothetical protein